MCLSVAVKKIALCLTLAIVGTGVGYAIAVNAPRFAYNRDL
jgi:hypothetical protein